MPHNFFNSLKRTDSPSCGQSPAVPRNFFNFDEQTIKAPSNAPSAAKPQKCKIFWPVQNSPPQYQPLTQKFWPECSKPAHPSRHDD